MQRDIRACLCAVIVVNGCNVNKEVNVMLAFLLLYSPHLLAGCDMYEQQEHLTGLHFPHLGPHFLGYCAPSQKSSSPQNNMLLYNFDLRFSFLHAKSELARYIDLFLENSKCITTILQYVETCVLFKKKKCSYAAQFSVKNNKPVVLSG